MANHIAAYEMHCAAFFFAPRSLCLLPACGHAISSALNELAGNREELKMDRRRQTRPRKATSLLLQSVAVLGSIALCEGLGVLPFARRLTSCGTSVARVGRPSLSQLASQAVEGGGMEPDREGIEQRERVIAGGVQQQQHQPWPADAPTTSASLLASFQVSTYTYFKIRVYPF